MAVPALTSNSPSVGSIAWGAFSIQFNGVSYNVGAGSTSQKFVWWLHNGGSPILNAGATLPTLSSDDLLLFLNKNGIAVNAMRTQVVDGSLIVSESILADAIGANQINGTKIAAGSISANHIVADTITANEIAANAITANEIAANAVTADEIAANAVTANELAANAVTATKILAGEISATHLAANTITANEIASNAITANELAANAVSADKIAANAVTATKILAGEVSAYHLLANTITANEIASAAITANELAAGAVIAEKIAAGAIIAGKIGANAITATELAAGAITAEKITGDQLKAKLAVVGGLTVGSGISITPENGIVIQTPTGQTKFPSNGTANNLSGDVTASSLTVLGQLAIRGVTNEISKNAKVTLQTGTTPPMAGPSVTATYPTHAIHEGWNSNGFVHYPTASRYYSIESFGDAIVSATFQDSNGDYMFAFESWSLKDSGPRPEIGHGLGGITMIGDNAYVLCGVNDEVVPGTYDGHWYIYKIHKETTGWSYVRRMKYEPPGVESQLGAISPHKPVIGTDGTNVIVAQASRASGNLNFTRYASTDLAYVSRTAVGSFNPTADATAFCVTSADVGGGPYYWTSFDSGRTVYCSDAAGTRQTAHEFQAATADLRGLLWDGSKFRSRTVATAHDYSGIKDTDLATSPINVVSTWRKADGTGPDFAQYETGISPKSSTSSFPKRATLTISTAPIPDDAGDPDDANSVSLYIARGVSPVLADYKRAATPAVGVTSATLNVLPTATGAPVAVPFPNATPGAISSAATDANGALIDLNGSGAGRVGPLVWTPSVGTGPRAAGLKSVSTAQAIANATWTMANIDESAPDYNFGFGTITNNSLTIPETGLYIFTAGANFNPHATGRRLFQVEAFTNEAVGAGIILAREERNGVSGVYATVTLSCEAYLTAGTGVRLCVYQNSGAALDLRHDFVLARLTGRLVRI